MNDQNTAMANRLKTLTHTKKTRATVTGAMPALSKSQNTARFATKKWYTMGMKRARVSFATNAP
jgi:hypothetical protein